MTFAVSGKELAAPIAGKGIDRNDGSYTCIYTVPARGNYSLDIKMDDVPIQVSTHGGVLPNHLLRHRTRTVPSYSLHSLVPSASVPHPNEAHGVKCDRWPNLT